MVRGFTLNGAHSSTFGVIMASKTLPVISATLDDYSHIAGKSGSYLTPKESVDGSIAIECGIATKTLYDLKVAIRKISAWIHSKQRVRLIFDDETDKYWDVKCSGAIGLSQMRAPGWGTFTLAFICQPFAQMVIPTSTEIPTWEDADFPWCIDMPWIMVDAYRFTATGATTFEFNHPGTQEVGQNSPQGSQANIKVVGSWTTLSLALNGKIIEYTETGTGTLVIDSVNMEATLGGVNKLDKIDGDLDSFLAVEPGENTIAVGGTGLDVTVTLDFVPLWL